MARPASWIFGIAKVLADERGPARRIVGTPSYMAPEQALGERVGPPADLYATGCVLFTLVTGAPPFAGSSTTATLRRHVDESPPTPSERLDESANKDLEALVGQALSKDPTERPASARAMAAELRHIARRARGEPEDAARDTAAFSQRPRKRSTNVRELPTAFLGRAGELATLADMFARGDRVVTLTCVAKKADGAACTTDNDCTGGLCDKAQASQDGNCATTITLAPLDSMCADYQ